MIYRKEGEYPSFLLSAVRNIVVVGDAGVVVVEDCGVVVVEDAGVVVGVVDIYVIGHSRAHLLLHIQREGIFTFVLYYSEGRNGTRGWVTS